MASFAGLTFGERGNGAQTFPVWQKRMLLSIKPLPAGNTPQIEEVGLDAQRLALVVKATQTELTALYDAVHTSGSLVFGYETCDAFLDSIDGVAEQSAGKNVYFATLNLIRL